MKTIMNSIKKYFNSRWLAALLALSACTPECYEKAEPQVYLEIYNSCHYAQLDARGIITPLNIENNCGENMGKVTLTLPLLENKKTYYLTDGFNTIDSFTLTYELTKTYQSRNCGYVVQLNHLVIDTSASSIKTYYRNDSIPFDTLHPYIAYTTFADYMRRYW
ncbi:hypothetical protein GC194_00020 [bacterium]|nr:hypothetical protein [bacterium]